MGYRNYSVGKGYIVSQAGTAFDGDFTDIQSAVNAIATLGGVYGSVIYLRPGTYQGNINLNSVGGITFAAYPGEQYPVAAGAPNTYATSVIITGTITSTNGGFFSFSNITFNATNLPKTLLSLGGSIPGTYYIDNCSFNTAGANSDPLINFSNSFSTSNLIIKNCQCDFAHSGNLITSSSVGTVSISNCNFANSSGTTTQNTFSAGSLILQNSIINIPITISSTANYSGQNNLLDCSAINTTPLTITSTGTCYDDNSIYKGGTASAISIGTGATLSSPRITVNSSNTDAISGAGTLDYGSIVYSGSSSLNAATTQTQLVTQGPYQTLISSQTASSSASISFTTGLSSNFKYYRLVGYNVLPDTASALLEMVASINGGTSYLNSGYLSGANGAYYNTATWGNSNSTSSFIIINPAATSTIPGCFDIKIFNCNSGTHLGINITGTGTYHDSTSTGMLVIGGTLDSSTAINALQLAMSSGNIASGTFELYGCT